VYGIGRRALGGENTGRTAAVFAALNMACIIWSAIAMRDIIIIYFVTLTLSDSIMIAKRLEVSKLLRLAVWLGIIYVFRPYATLILICSIGITFALQPKKPILRFLIGCLFAGLLIGVIVVGGVQAIALEVIQSQTDQLNNARSIITYQTSHDQGYAPDVQYETPIDIVKFIPAGLFYFWAGPLPFGYGAREFIFAIPEIVSWYVTFWYGFRGFLYLRGSKKTLVPLLIFFLLGSFLLSAICGNYAEAIRLRSMLSAPLQLAAGIGWTYRRKRMLDMAGAA
jgi:4-amino-4-deoxy-L-arabinose transferase-like glycosyltransferase